jgi:chemotaxis regulatin CheY-phosphate phosphatase CheZ
MDQSEIDALMKNAPAKPVKGGKEEPAPAVPAARTAPAAVQAGAGPAPVAQDGQGHVISELDAVTAVTERETNKVMDQLDLISSLVGKQQNLITGLLTHPAAQDPSVQQAVNQVMAAAKEIQDKVYEAMDLMQFQDITRQKLERIVHHLRQIHDYIVELLGTGLKSEGERASISRTIATTGTTPDEKKLHADSVVEEFKRRMTKD